MGHACIADSRPMSRGRRSNNAWAALAVAVLGLLGASQIGEADLMRVGRAVLRVFNESRQPERAPRSPGAPLAGQPRIIDGDTLDLNGVRVRMQGIDALEHDQQCNRREGGRYACGAAARETLARLVGNRPITCTPDGTETHGRSVAICTLRQDDGAELDLNGAMVRSGYAFDCPRYSKGRYAREEAAAKAEGIGAWAGRFQYPWSHRDRAGACGR